MNKNRLKNLLNCGILLFGISLSLTNCSNDNEIVIEEKSKFLKGLTHQSFSSIKNISLVHEKTSRFIKSKNQFNRTSSDSITFTIDTTAVQVIESQIYKSYTFKADMFEEVDSILNNYVLTIYNDNSYNQMLVTYPIIGSIDDASYDVDNAIAEPIDGDIVLYARGGCDGYTVTSWVETCVTNDDCGCSEPYEECEGAWVHHCEQADSIDAQDEPIGGSGSGSGGTTTTEEDDAIAIVPFKNDIILFDDDCSIPDEAFNSSYSTYSPFNVDLSSVRVPCDETMDTTNVVENAKFMCIYNKLAASPKFKTLFVDTFEEENSEMNVKFEIVDFPPNLNGDIASGETTLDNPPNLNNQTIKLDRQHLLNDHPLIVAQTIIHEALHAFITSKIAICIEDETTTVTYDDINGENPLSFDELLNDFYIDCDVVDLFDHRLMYNRMVDVMDEMLFEVLDDLVAPMDINANFEINSNYNFSWNDAIHHLNLSGLQKAKEYIEDAIGDPQQNIPPTNPDLSFLVLYYYITVNCNTCTNNFNKNICNE